MADRLVGRHTVAIRGGETAKADAAIELPDVGRCGCLNFSCWPAGIERAGCTVDRGD